jgi:hypothetical protein
MSTTHLIAEPDLAIWTEKIDLVGSITHQTGSLLLLGSNLLLVSFSCNLLLARIMKPLSGKKETSLHGPYCFICFASCVDADDGFSHTSPRQNCVRCLPCFLCPNCKVLVNGTPVCYHCLEDVDYSGLAPNSVLASATGHVEHRDMTARASFSVHAQIKQNRP